MLFFFLLILFFILWDLEKHMQKADGLKKKILQEII